MPVKKIVYSDMPEILAVLAGSVFQREGFVLLPGRGVGELYRLIETEAPALAIVDLDNLGKDGLDCCRRLKSDPLLRATPLVVLLPNAAGERLVAGCRQAGCETVLPKPLAATALLDAACTLLGVNRRLARRFPVDIQVTYAVADGRQHPGRGLNLHADGLFVAAEKLFPVGTGLLVKLHLPGHPDPLVGYGRVAWVNHPEWWKKHSLPIGMGVQLCAPPEDLRRILQAFIDTSAR